MVMRPSTEEAMTAPQLQVRLGMGGGMSQAAMLILAPLQQAYTEERSKQTCRRFCLKGEFTQTS